MSLTPRQEKVRGYAIEVMRDLLARGIIERADSIPKALSLVKDEALRGIVPDLAIAMLDIGASLTRGGAERLFEGSPIGAFVSSTLDGIFGEHGKRNPPTVPADKAKAQAAREAGRAMMATAKEIEEDR